MVILTGGEPSLWIDDHLIDLLHRPGNMFVSRRMVPASAGGYRLDNLFAQARCKWFKHETEWMK